ncbi:toll/interleukin-1 receptor domain-containing protein [Streptomyces sp. BP-8]|uniref:Toll/interleukin-1 receptor domain-containing protein n=1 Tax=Streptomyces sirii TaxID=3127701 RepID=A0ABZ2QJ24_9ACTN
MAGGGHEGTEETKGTADPPVRSESARRTVTVFVSYSRREFHFAEAVTATLRSQAALDPWFDVQRLRPGMDWAKALDESLDHADALLLLASPAALASAYVRREWTRALERGIPLHIGVVEAVELPPELAGFPVHDLRTRFWERAAELAEAMAQARTDTGVAAPRPNRFGLPGRMPTPVAATVVLSVLTSIALVWAIVLLVGLDLSVVHLAWNPFDHDVPWVDRGSALEVMRTKRWQGMMFGLLGLTALAAPLAPCVLVPGMRLVRRRSSRTALAIGFVVTVGVGLTVLVGVGLVMKSGELRNAAVTELFFPTPPEMTAVAEMLGAPLAGAVVCAAAGAVVVGRSRTLHLWLPTGANGDHHRTRIIRMRRARQQFAVEWTEFRAAWDAYPSLDTSALPRGADVVFMTQWKILCERLAALPAPVGEAPVTVEVRCPAPAEEAVAHHLRVACRQAGMAAGASPARWVLVLVSSQAPWPETARAIRRLGPRAICVLLDTVRLPSDAAELRRHQWLDFRERRPGSLFQLLAALRSPEADTAGEFLPPTPVITERYLAPAWVRYFVTSCRNITAFFPGFALVAVVLRPWQVQSTLLAAVTLLLVVHLVRMGNLAATRRISASRFRTHCVVASVLSFAWAGVAISVLWIPVTLSSTWRGQWSYIPKDRVSGLTLVALLGATAALPALITLFFPYFYLLLRGQWLPPTVTHANSPILPRHMGTWTGFEPVSSAPGMYFALLIEFWVAYA